MLKLGIFNQLFDEFLDMTAERGSKDEEIVAKQIEDFKRRVVPQAAAPRCHDHAYPFTG